MGMRYTTVRLGVVTRDTTDVVVVVTAPQGQDEIKSVVQSSRWLAEGRLCERETRLFLGPTTTCEM